MSGEPEEYLEKNWKMFWRSWSNQVSIYNVIVYPKILKREKLAILLWSSLRYLGRYLQPISLYTYHETMRPSVVLNLRSASLVSRFRNLTLLNFLPKSSTRFILSMGRYLLTYLTCFGFQRTPQVRSHCWWSDAAGASFLRSFPRSEPNSFKKYGQPWRNWVSAWWCEAVG